ncbi:anti-sigma-I factor RsgI family protein [Clostridium akagii]|uniref:anti-sigma-I factor RsgI family protein n=1 Tax=Clostridium akagii TaxID=91623 RepID=UPI00047AFABC|nr:hypothetical protein [Clostridium akagii]
MDENKRVITINSYEDSSSSEPDLLPKQKKFTKLKSILLFLIIIIILGAIVSIYAYFTPTSFVIIDANASINLKVNRWNKIIDISSLDGNGNNIITTSKLKYKNINEGLVLILSTAEQNNYINVLSPDEKMKKISVFISGHNINTSYFSSIALDRKFDLDINQNGSSSN